LTIGEELEPSSREVFVGDIRLLLLIGLANEQDGLSRDGWHNNWSRSLVSGQGSRHDRALSKGVLLRGAQVQNVLDIGPDLVQGGIDRVLEGQVFIDV